MITHHHDVLGDGACSQAFDWCDGFRAHVFTCAVGGYFIVVFALAAGFAMRASVPDTWLLS